MVDLAITASQVLAGTTGADFYYGVAAETITAGQALYLNASNLLALADANASVLTAAVKGIALHAALANQPLKIQTAGDLTLGAAAAPVVGTVYIASGTAGGIAPVADKVTGWFCTILGVGKTGNILNMDVFVSGSVTP